MSILSAPHFHDEAAAFAKVEAALWPNGPACFHCGAADRISAIKPNPAKRVRFGLKKCGHCKKQFTVRMGTISSRDQSRAASGETADRPPHGRLPICRRMPGQKHLSLGAPGGASLHPPMSARPWTRP